MCGKLRSKHNSVDNSILCVKDVSNYSSSGFKSTMCKKLHLQQVTVNKKHSVIPKTAKLCKESSD